MQKKIKKIKNYFRFLTYISWKSLAEKRLYGLLRVCRPHFKGHREDYCLCDAQRLHQCKATDGCTFSGKLLWTEQVGWLSKRLLEGADSVRVSFSRLALKHLRALSIVMQQFGSTITNHLGLGSRLFSINAANPVKGLKAAKQGINNLITFHIPRMKITTNTSVFSQAALCFLDRLGWFDLQSSKDTKVSK